MIINSNINQLVTFYDESEYADEKPVILMQCALAVLQDLINKVETPQGTIEDAIAMLIVANGDY